MINKFKRFNINRLFIGLIIPITFFFVGINAMNDYGETTDEKFDQHIGEFYYYDWKEKGVEGLRNRFIPLQRNYGPLFDIAVVASNDWLHKKLEIIKNPVASYHFPVLLISSIAIYIVFLFAYFNWGLIPAIFSSLALALLPRFIGDSQNNLKDTPLMTFFSITLLFFFFAVKKNNLFLYALAGIFLGLTYVIKINALIILPIIWIWYFTNNKLSFKEIKRTTTGFCLSISTAFITILASWPYYRYDPIARFLETYSTFKNHEWNEYVLYLGQHYRGHDIPWHYPFVMFGVTTPIFYLILIVLGVCLVFYSIFYNTRYKSSLVFVLIWIMLPPLTQAVSGAPMYDGIRHYLTILPPLALLMGFTAWYLGRFLEQTISRHKKLVLILYFLIISLNYINILWINIRFHPYEIVYFNELTRGVKGAKEKFDLDYWGQSLKETAEWINKNLPTESTIWLTLPMAHHFPVDRERFALVDRLPDYKINLIRGMLKTWDTEDDYLHPKRKPIYSIKVDGAEILQIFEYKENKEILDNALLIPTQIEKSIGNQGIRESIFENNSFSSPESKSFIVPTVGFSCAHNNHHNKSISLRYQGYLYVKEDNLYCFHINSDDDTLFKLNNINIIHNNSMNQTEKRIYLKVGYYQIQVDYVNNIGNACLQFLWSANQCRDFTQIPNSVLFH